MSTTRTSRSVPLEIENTSAELAEIVDFLAARVQSGIPLDPEQIAAEFPEFADDLRQILPAVGLLGALSQSQDSLGVGTGPPDVLTGTLGDYQIVREVGRGGMGIVYEAEQISLPRRVALKVLPFAAVMDPRHLQRFRNEARAAASLDHPHVVKVFGVGCERGVHFIALQFVDGRSMADLIRNRRDGTTAPLAGAPDTEVTDRDGTVVAPPFVRPASTGSRTPLDTAFVRRAVQWGIHAAEALEHAHSLGIVHRDVKPGNLLIDGRGEVFVADFGLAKVSSDPGVTSPGDLLGTLRYMSPEQAGARHDLVDHRADIYALGVTLYELLTLTPAFPGESREELLGKITTTEPVSPRKLDRAIPRDLETIVLMAMEKDPAHRYQSARELADDLGRFLNHEPVRAQPAMLAQRARKWSRRHPAVVRSAVFVLVLVAIGSSLSTWLVWREKDRTTNALAAETTERQRADAEKRTAQERDAEATALLRFFEEQILAPIRPQGQEGGLGHDVKLRQAIEAALPAVARDFGDKPLIEARLRRTIGLSFKYLGDSTAAAVQFELVRVLYIKNLGIDHSDTLAATNNLANSYTSLGRYEEALRLHQETLAARRATMGDDHADTLATENNLAISFEKVGRHVDALALREATLRRTRDRLGDDHMDTLRGMNNLGISYTTFGRHEQAVKMREETLMRMKAKFGPDHPNTLACRHNLAQSYHATSQYADSLRLYEETLELAKAKLPPDHEKTLLVMNNLAWLLVTAGDPKLRDTVRAVELAEKAARLSPRDADFRGTLGAARYRSGDWEGASRELEEAIRLRGPDDAVNANESFFLAMAREQLGDRAGARVWFDRGVTWMARSNTRTDEVRRFRTEASVVLRLNDPPPP
jgi:serine/threonine protein kinase/tetratricopeptide (TPR) repeat protein